MKFRFSIPTLLLLFAVVASPAHGDVFEDYEGLAEGFLGTSFSSNGVNYHDANNVSGFFPDGNPFDTDDLGNQFIIEDADLIYDDFPSYGSRQNSLTFGTAFVPGDNFSIGALASMWMTPDELGTAASLDLAYYENGPWGGIVFVLDAIRNGSVVATDSVTIADGGGRDNVTFATLSTSGPTFDSLHLYATLNGDYSGPRAMIDDLRITGVPEPATTAVLIGCAAIGFVRRRRA